jgi:hypothetical protein
MTPISSKDRQFHAVGKIKQLYHSAEDFRLETRLIPLFWVEARIDFNDVRTGFRETVGINKALEIYSDNADLLWTKDMVREVDPLKTTSSAPDGAQIGALPDFVDANFLARMEHQFIQYLLRSFEVKIFRNFNLKIYSLSGESRHDFCRRCFELFDGSRRQELDRLHEVFDRRLEQARQKYLSAPDSGGMEQAKSDSRGKDAFSRCSERISQLFYDAELRIDPTAEAAQHPAGNLELDEKLLSIEWEAHQALAKLLDQYDEQARAIDEYILHPNLKDIHLVRSCILWMPKGAV